MMEVTGTAVQVSERADSMFKLLCGISDSQFTGLASGELCEDFLGKIIGAMGDQLDALATTRAELADAHATIHQLGENAAKAAGEYAEEVGRLREALEYIRDELMSGAACRAVAMEALTEPTDG